MSPLLRFAPIYHTRVWGGRSLETHLGRQLPDAQPYGEAWDLVDRPEAQSIVTSPGPYAGLNLNTLWNQHRAAVFGANWQQQPSPRFPLLIKVLDCTEDLSLQVHPPSHRAAELGGEPKTEMWFVAAATSQASLYAGVKPGTTEHTFRAAIETGTLADLIHRLPAAPGDSLHVPSGRLHALGKGLLIYEIQQNSDTTYRVFDWNRLGLDGKPRDLHVEQSLLSIDFTDDTPLLASKSGILSQCDYFTVRKSQTGDNPLTKGCRIIMAVSQVSWHGETLLPSTVAIEPARAQPSAPQGEWLEISLGTSQCGAVVPTA